MDTLGQNTLVIVFTTVGVAFAAGFVLIAYWAVRNGQFKDVEGVKYRMMDDFNSKRSDPRGDEFQG